VDSVRLGRVIRALRIRRRWRQIDLARRAGVSQSLIARVERGHADRIALATLERIVSALGARLNLRVDWNGEAADRLLDADHAALVDTVISVLRADGWEPVPEVTFAIDGERGSIDILGWHPWTRTLLVVEVKSVVADVQATISVFDRKQRLGARIGRLRGWDAARVAAVLVLAEGTTNRRRIALHAGTFASRFPLGSRAIRRFLHDPGWLDGPVGGLWFLSPSTGATARRRATRVRVAA
jgi:transcriptional regulator with XRE-family HTH domain